MLALIATTALAQNIDDPAAPDDTTAMLLSTVVGFGEGHYYAGRPLVGNRFAAVQVGSLALEGVGLAMMVDANHKGNQLIDSQEQQIRGARSELFAGEGIMFAAGAAFILDRTIDIIQAPRSARRTRQGL